jgi:hypothetical protein
LVRSSLREWSWLVLERCELAVEVVDDAQQRRDRLQPDVRDAVLGELVERARLAQRGDAAARAPLGLQSEGAVDRRGAQADQVCAPAQPLADRAVIQRRHPDRGVQVAAGEVGEHPRVAGPCTTCSVRLNSRAA